MIEARILAVDTVGALDVLDPCPVLDFLAFGDAGRLLVVDVDVYGNADNHGVRAIQQACLQREC